MDTIKIISKPLQSIVLIRLLTGKEQYDLSEKLIDYINKLDAHTHVEEYYKIVVSELVENKDEIIKKWKSENEGEPELLLYEYLYKCVIKMYGSALLETVCQKANNNMLLAKFEDDLAFVEGIGLVLKSANPDMFSEASGVPELKIDKRLSIKDINELQKKLLGSIIGQDKVIDKLIDYVKLKEAGFVSFFSLLLIGKTGSGKTYTAQKLAEFYTQGRVFTIDCALATDGHEKSSLLGSPPGYIGHTGTSYLGEKAKVSDNWVILIDEVEKANDKTLDNLLNFIDTGRITDNNGHELDFSKSIFILTSNQGIEYQKKDSKIGWNRNKELEEQKDEDIISNLEKRFKKEFLNRIDQILVVNDLKQEDVEKIIKLELKPYPVVQTEELIKFISSKAYSAEYGARNVKRFIKEHVGVPIANAILSSSARKKKFNLRVEDNKLAIF